MGHLSGASERAVVFGRARHLVGILNEPARESGEPYPFVVFLNSGIIHHVGANRLYVRLARALARSGVASLRFDLSGIGDSGAPGDDATIPRGEIERRDIDDALSMLAADGAQRFVLAGLCSGADNAFATMVSDPRVVGALMLDGFAFRTVGYFVRYYGPRLVRPGVWWRTFTGRSRALKGFLTAIGRRLTRWSRPARDRISLAASTHPTRGEMRRQWLALVGRDARVLLVFTAGLEARYNYRGQFFAAFRGLDFGNTVQHEYFGESDHIFSRERDQARLEQLLIGWFHGAFDGAREPAPTASAPGPVAHA
jgi:pimeloyl-ACP methyl ester carboxylesterase